MEPTKPVRKPWRKKPTEEPQPPRRRTRSGPSAPAWKAAGTAPYIPDHKTEESTDDAGE